MAVPMPTQEVTDVQDQYTFRDVEAMLTRHLHRRDELNLHGNVASALRDMSRTGTRSAAVNDAVIERADLMRGLARLEPHHRRLLVLWYASDWSTDRIVAWYRQRPPYPGRRTVFRWRVIAIRRMVKIMNGTA